MKLSEYIHQHHGGNQSAFARANGIKPPQVTVMLATGRHYVIDGHIYIMKRKLGAKIETTEHQLDLLNQEK